MMSNYHLHNDKISIEWYVICNVIKRESRGQIGSGIVVEDFRLSDEQREQ